MKKGSKSEADILRKKPESLLSKRVSIANSKNPDAETLKLIHELEVHQIELELQNEELRLAKERIGVEVDKYVELYDFAPSGYFTLASDGKIIELNLKASQMLGNDRTHLRNHTFCFFVADKSKPIFNLFLQKVFFGKTTETCEITLSSDVNLPVYLHLSGIADKNGEKCFLTAVDITERRVAQEALQASEKRYRTTIETISDAFFTLDNELKFTYFNKQAEVLLLKKSSDVLGKQIFSEVFKEARGSVFEENYAYALLAKEICTFETFFGIEPYTNWYDVRVYPGTEGISVFFTVITERKNADSALRLSLSKYQTLFGLFPAGITISDSNGQIIETNNIAQRMLGLDPEEQKQRQIDGKEWQIVRPDGSPMPASEYASVRALNERSQIENVEMGVVTGNSQTTWLNVSATPIPIEGYGVAIIYTDITSRKRAEKELLIAKEKAEESDHLKSAFLANMSHEIRTPMNGVLGFAELLKEPKLSGEEQKKYIDIIQRSGTRLLNIINDIIDISKIEAGQMAASISETNVNEKIEDIYNFFKQLTNQKGIHFSYNSALPSIQSIIKTDGEKLYAILSNLVNNAIKYTHSGTIEFGYVKKEGMLEFFVIDSGIGVSQAQKEIIFERFRQGGKQLTKNFEGTGLGLSISKAYVEMLGGKIWVESEEGQGSAFYFTIPYSTEKQVQSNNANILPAEEGSSQIKTLKILIAEDDETSDLLITSILSKNSHELLHATTGVETIEVCRNNPDLDLVLMDIRMPDISGLEATRQIRQFNNKVIVIAQTAYALAGDRESAIQAGCNDFISKPIVPEELLALIRKYFKLV